MTTGIGPFVWAMPHSANIVLRNFLCDHWRYRHHLPALRHHYRASAGADHCRMLPLAFPAAVRHDGWDGRWCDRHFAVLAFAVLAFAGRVVPTEQADVGFAMIFPSMTVAKILFVQIAALLLAR